ncbi:uncharacterized protein LOC131892078 [Tigriopus californicus]|uniref:uncharacterized protein LOC131892078 n=1 Tax=Tigriopus californicus TaxID=6832 RepID=UPI0027DA5530|nr:uncharacterized protein LOC131892078 [Tigriopus californicus]
MEESSGMVETILEVPECLASGSENYDINILNPSGCYIFKTTGFDNGGYPNFTGWGGIDYLCAYTLKFGTPVDGKVTVKQERFEFQEESNLGDCPDSILIRDVDDIDEKATNSDGDDRDGRNMVVTYCGTIDEDKTRDFSQSELSIDLFADQTVNGNGAEIHICID